MSKETTATGRQVGRWSQLVTNAQGQLMTVTKMGKAEVNRLNIHRARARRNQIAALLAIGQMDEVQREMLEEEEAELEDILRNAYASSSNPVKGN